MVDYGKNNRSAIRLSRFYRNALLCYNSSEDRENNQVWFWSNFDIFSFVDPIVVPFLWEEILRLVQLNGINYYRKLDIWDKEFLLRIGVADPRMFWHRLIHSYLHITQPAKSMFIIRALDKILSYII